MQLSSRRHAPELFDLCHCDLPLLHDDRLGASLERLATATTPEMILALPRTAIREFVVWLDERNKPRQGS